MSFRRRAYTEVLDNLLTGIIGGVSAEAYAFPATKNTELPFTHAMLSPPVRDVVSIYGLRNGQSYLFKKDADYTLAEDQQTLVWQESAQLPDAGSVFHVNYLHGENTGNINDLYVGSVVRTLCESVGLEIARLNAQLEGVYESGFIDTASGRALDNVVSILGAKRVKAGRFSCELEFTRVSGSRGEINIFQGSRVITEDGNVEYETTASVTMIDGQNTIRVQARDKEENTQGLAAGELNIMAKPITGIEKVTNPVPSSIASADETDNELRTRAKNFLHGSERATIASIQEAVSRQGIPVEVLETQGLVQVIPHADNIEPELLARIKQALQDVKPAGVVVEFVEDGEAPSRVNLALRIETASDLLEQDLRAIQETATIQITDYFNSLPINQPGSVNKLIGLMMGVDGIQDMEILQVTTGTEQAPISDADLNKGQLGLLDKTTVLGELKIIDPNLPTLLKLVIRYNPEDIPASISSPPDSVAIDSALSVMVNYLNVLNQQEELDDDAQRELSLAKLLFVLPLQLAGSSKPEGSIDEVLLGVIPDGLLTEQISPFSVQFVFIKENGISQILLSDADAYQLNPFERLTLGEVEIIEEPNDG